MLLYIFLLLVGFLVLFKSADQFVIGSIATANKLNISPMVIGLTVVALGTSAPEIFIAGAASFAGKTELAVGNAIGSNIANIGLVLGITALLVPLSFPKESLRHDLPLMIAVTLLSGLILMDLKLDRWEGVVLLLCLALFFVRMAFVHRNSDKNCQCSKMEEAHVEGFDCEHIEPKSETELPNISLSRALSYVLISLIFLLLSSELLVFAVVNIARLLGVSELLIGLSVIAVGTSLPELVVSVSSALKGYTDLAIGNIMGSNIFNILAVLSIPGIIAPAELHPDLLRRDYLLMLSLSLVVTLFAYGILTKPIISRLKGLFLFTVWLSYLAYLYYSSLQDATVGVPFLAN